MKKPLKVSIIIPTRDRPKDLAELLLTALDQDYPPFEVIIVDDSVKDTARHIADMFKSDLERIGCRVQYIRGSGDGLTAARNLGVKAFEGDLILFLDDDTLLDRNTIRELVFFIEKNPRALGVQPKILTSTPNIGKSALSNIFENSLYKVFMLTYGEENRQAVRSSGMSVFPSNLTKVITVQRLSGCCCCLKREVFKNLKFDETLKRWGFMEDLDFSYRLFKKHPNSLYMTPHAKIFHKGSMEGKLPSQLSFHMTVIYWFYVFFKEFFDGSVLNLMAFLWAQTGYLLTSIGGIIMKRKKKQEWWTVIWLLNSYFVTFKNLKNILAKDLDFFNKNLNTKR
ncbi:MAG: glycosyltransferase [Candidatus Methanomethyliaceae archaeon]